MYVYGKKTKIGKVSIEQHLGAFRLRFTHPKGKRHEIRLSNESEESYNYAIRKARQINSDIENDCFDFDYIRYKPELAKSILVSPKKPKIDLKKIWEQYKQTNKHISELTTQKASWKQTDSCLDKVSEKALRLNQTDLLLSELLEVYSVGTLERVVSDLKAACYLSLKQGQIDKNPFVGLKLPRRARKKIECYESEEIKVILQAFKSDEYLSPYARVPHSYYYHYVKFVALTFCRPEDAIALTWSDLRVRSNGTFITFSKAYSRGILKDGKTNEIRVFRCNQELRDFLRTIPYRPNQHNLLFPTPKSKSYMNQRAWGRDVWKPLVTKLASLRKVHKYLKFYSLRHSGITRLVRAGIDVATIARLAGTSPEIILNNYLAARDEIDLPPM